VNKTDNNLEKLIFGVKYFIFILWGE